MAKLQVGDVEEQKRLNDAREAGMPWKKWGPYLSERQWGTVREDYSDDGNAWDYFSHDQSRSRAYRWGEDGLGGISDDHQRLCFAVALWNERDPILKERLFGLTNSEGESRRGREGVLLLPRQHADALVHEVSLQVSAAGVSRIAISSRRTAAAAARRSSTSCSTPACSTTNRYFDVFVEYAKAQPEDVLVRITVHNRGPEAGRLHVLPTLWFRNTWSWGDDDTEAVVAPGRHRARSKRRTTSSATYSLLCDGSPELLFTENESNAQRLWGQPNPSPYVKDAFHSYIVSGQRDAVNPARVGTKAAAHYALDVPAGGQPDDPRAARRRRRRQDAFRDFDEVFTSRIADADEFYARITPRPLGEDAAPRPSPGARRHAVEQAVLLLRPRAVAQRAQEPPAARGGRGEACGTRSGSTCSTPTSSRCRTSGSTPGTPRGTWRSTPSSLALVDFDFAKEQLLLMLRNLYFHPNGQIPAYEWNFSDVNPPGARLGHAVPVQDGADAGPRRHALPGAVVPGR